MNIRVVSKEGENGNQRTGRTKQRLGSETFQEGWVQRLTPIKIPKSGYIRIFGRTKAKPGQ